MHIVQESHGNTNYVETQYSRQTQRVWCYAGLHGCTVQREGGTSMPPSWSMMLVALCACQAVLRLQLRNRLCQPCYTSAQ
jgi:hypothetical protein